MKLDEIVAWYQKKIGTYDKQQWEKTVEQKILDGFSSVTLKNAKLKTDLIDVDLVRGSTFPKAKPKQNLLTVIRLAILRYLFLPLYAQWWVKQTSPNIFALLLLMYVAQMITWAVYTFNIQRVAANEDEGRLLNATLTANTNDEKPTGEEQHLVTLSELLIPMALSLLLSLIHSQIVATNTATGGKVKRRRFSNASQGSKLTRDLQKVKRRKKLVKVRTQEAADGTINTTMTAALTQAHTRKTNISRIFNSNVEVFSKVPVSSSDPPIASFEHQTKPDNTPNSTPTNSTAAKLAISNNIETFPTTSAILKKSYQADAAATLKLDLKAASLEPDDCCPNVDNHTDSCSNSSSNFMHKKRNVNWHSPIHNYAIETQEKQQQTSPQSQFSSTTTSEMNSPSKGKLKDIGAGGGGGSSTNSSSNNGSPNKTVRIDECVQEFYEDLIAEATTNSGANAGASENANNARFVLRRPIGEDDGFESLNGKSSSGEENHSPAPTTSALAMQNQLRLRLNAGQNNRPEGGELKTANSYRRKIPLSSESDYEKNQAISNSSTNAGCDAFQQSTTKKLQTRVSKESSDETDEEGDVGEVISSPNSLSTNSNYNECTTSATEWLGVTTNSEECSYSSELDNSDDYKNRQISDEDGYDLDFAPATILTPHGITDRISCTIWDQREIKKAQLSVLEISSCIIERVESMPETNDYIYIGICFSFLLSLIPSFCRLCELTIDASKSNEINYFDMPMLVWEKASFSSLAIFCFAFGHTQWERTILVISFLQRLCLTLILFIIFAVAERTFKQRFLYAKLFSHITSSRRARKSNLPHFRLNKVRNIKTWLSVRSYLKKRGPQRSVDIIVSAAFIVTLLLLAFLSVEWLKDSVHLHSRLNLEALMWSTTIGIFLLRFMTLGNKIHQKYRSISVLITEQINLYLQIEQKPKKKDELMVANSVLKLAADLLKELETPFKISGLSANPYLFTTIKVVILSALSGVLSEMLGFKLKLHKIKIK